MAVSPVESDESTEKSDNGINRGLTTLGDRLIVVNAPVDELISRALEEGGPLKYEYGPVST
jgi:hypothetical protein